MAVSDSGGGGDFNNFFTGDPEFFPWWGGGGVTRSIAPRIILRVPLLCGHKNSYKFCLHLWPSAKYEGVI